MAQSECVVVNAATASNWRQRGGPQPAAQTCRAGAYRAGLGGSRGGADAGAHRPGQPADGVAVATALCRGRGRGPVARPDPQTWQSAIAGETAARLVALTCTEPPQQATHWTGRATAKTVGISLRSVQRIWQAHDLQPHRIRTFKRSRDPGFAAKLADIVGLYVDPPAHAVVLSLDEKSQIQALDRTQPGLPRSNDQTGSLHDHDARLQAPWHDNPVRRA
jgi:hypothetical protein